MNHTTIRHAMLAAGLLVAGGAAPALGYQTKPTPIQANPTGVNAQPGDGSTTPPAPNGSKSAATPGAPQSGGAAPAGAPTGAQPGPGGAPVVTSANAPENRPNPSGKPPTVIGPGGVPTATATAARRASRNALFFNAPRRHAMRIGVSTTTGDSSPSNAAGATANVAVSIPLPSLGGGVSTGQAIASATGGVLGESSSGSVHTWTRTSSSLTADATRGAGQSATSGMPSNSLVGSSLTSSNAHASTPGGVPVGIVNDMLTRIGGMATVLPSQKSASAD